MDPSTPVKTLAQYSYETCDHYADKVAVVDGEQKYSFQTARYDSNRVAETLLEITKGGSVPIVIIAESRYAGAIAILAISKIGAYSTFIEPTQAEDHAARIARQLETDLILTTAKHEAYARRVAPNARHIVILDALLGQGFCPDVLVNFDPNLPSNIFFTSGSTGEPKGLVHTYRRSLNGLIQVIKHSNLTADDVQSCTMSFSFGWGVPPIRYAMICGSPMSFFQYDQHTPLETAEWMERDGLTVLQMPSAYFHQFVTALIDHPDILLPKVRLINTGGEKVRAESLRAWQSLKGLNCNIRDSFSSSEASTFFTREFTKSSPIQDEIVFDHRRDYADVFIRTEAGELKTRDAEGEIVVHTPYLFAGYFKNPTLTAEKLIPHPTDPSKLVFLTGDTGRLDHNGHLHLGGRADHLVKIRGYRMDLEEIRAEIKKLDVVQEAAVIKTTNKRGESHLAAYIQYKPGKHLTNTDLKMALLAYLSPYKVPQSFTILESFPTATAGKIQISKLPPISRKRPEIRSAFSSAETDTELRLCEIWEETLDLDGIGIDDDFFELGGDSISVLEVLSAIEHRFNVPASNAIFEHGTIRELARYLDAGVKTEQDVLSAVRKRSSQIRSESYAKKHRWNIPSRIMNRYMKQLTYRETLQMLDRWSKNAFVQNVLYWRHKPIFRKWMERIESQIPFQKAYQQHILSELQHLLATINHDRLQIISGGSKPTGPETLFEQSLTSALYSTPPRAEFDLVPMIDFHHLLTAMDAGKGVLLVAMHGNVRLSQNFIIQHLAGSKPLHVVTHNSGKFGKYGEDPDEAESHEFASSNAAVSADAKRRLADGQILVFYNDTIELRTKNYMATILGSQRPFKAGFAEMALMTGATIIPMVSVITKEGLIGKRFFPPLITQKTNHEEKVLDLVQQYANFVETAWREHPETQSLSKIKKYFKKY